MMKQSNEMYSCFPFKTYFYGKTPVVNVQIYENLKWTGVKHKLPA